MQIKLGFESSSLQLILTIVCAADLTYRPNGAARNPYAKVSCRRPEHRRIDTDRWLFHSQIFLLPCHSDKSKRRTKTLASTNEPRWGQTFIFSGLRRADLNSRLLEVSAWRQTPTQWQNFSNRLLFSLFLPHPFLQITLWDYVRYGVNDFLGEIVVDLHNHPLDDEPEWYMLQPHQESNYPGGVRNKIFQLFFLFLLVTYLSTTRTIW